MDKVIVTVLLIIAGLTASYAVFNAVYPAVQRGGQSMSDAAGDVSDRIASRIEIIHTSTINDTVNVWVKNVGSVRIQGVNRSDVFFGEYDDVSRIPPEEESASPPYWSWELEGSYTQWEEAVTANITIHMAEALSSGVYELTVFIPNGVSDETSFSVE
jgi:hypothetical protein